MPEQQTVARGPVRGAERAPAPDLARGVMLLLIVVSNTGFHLFASAFGPDGHPVGGSVADRVVRFAVILTLDMKVYPLFSFLLGYGMMQLFLRQTAAGTGARGAARVLRRRSGWLVAFGFLHATLLMASEILTFYGIVTLILGWLFVRRRNRTLAVAAALSAVLTVLLALPELAATGTPEMSNPVDELATGEPDLVAAAGRRFLTWCFLVFAGAIGWLVSPQIILGFLAARYRILEEPARHRRLLRWTAALGIPIGWLGALPAALAHVGAAEVAPAAAAALRDLTGVCCGLGYVALFGLVAARARPTRLGAAVRAVGKRSLSSYLAHSLLFAPVLAAWGLGLGAHLGSATMLAFAVLVWLVTVAAADALERRGRPGPAEHLLRRLSYPRRSAAALPLGGADAVLGAEAAGEVARVGEAPRPGDRGDRRGR